LAIAGVLLAQTSKTAPATAITVKTATTAPASAPATASAPAINKQDTSYSIGLHAGRRFIQEVQQNGIDVDVPAMLQGIEDGLKGAPSRLSEAQMQAGLEEVNRQAEAKKVALAKEAEAQRAEQAEKNRVEGEAYLAANAKREGVTVLPDGLQYEVIRQGEGPRPQPTDTVKVHYRGTFIDGTEFDSSYKRDKPVSFPLNAVIKGWTEGVGLMPVGSKYKLYIPSDLAYGPAGRGARMPPNSVLVFEVELLENVAKDAGASASAPASQTTH
jgi:FKBP-type peptidyl-prolyl cis-trans isomerase